MSELTTRSFSLWRIAVGVYFLFATLINWPYIFDEISIVSMIQSKIIPTEIPAEFAVNLTMGLRAFASILLVLGKWSRSAAGTLFLCNYASFIFMDLYTSPHIEAVNWCLIAFCLLPSSAGKGRRRFASHFRFATWLLLSTVYFSGGIDKFYSDIWLQGLGLSHILMYAPFSTNLGYSFAIDFPLLTRIFNYLVMIGQCFFWCFCIYPKARPWALILSCAGWCFSLLFLNLWLFVGGMLLTHLFVASTFCDFSRIVPKGKSYEI